PSDNATPHILLLRLFESYDERIWRAVKEQTPFHKLSYKLSEYEMDLKDTYYSQIICVNSGN
ncbi:capsular polysaccharide synthesis protein, partial [Romboutsia ilealis]|uniref:capsular polysaccharide synthesis protein n=1 Tax=Romboutsia ilealis TaxID=1115758 RepID=UPI00272B7170